MSDSVGQYLNEIGMVPLLNAQEERELSQIIEAGADARAREEAGETGREVKRAIRAADRAKDRFIRANLRLVVSVARRYPLPPGMELLDLIRRAILVWNTRSTSSIGGKASSSRPTPPSGSARQSAGPSIRRPAWSVSPATAQPAFGPPCVPFPATVTNLTRSTPGSTD